MIDWLDTHHQIYYLTLTAALACLVGAWRAERRRIHKLIAANAAGGLCPHGRSRFKLCRDCAREWAGSVTLGATTAAPKTRELSLTPGVLCIIDIERPAFLRTREAICRLIQYHPGHPCDYAGPWYTAPNGICHLAAQGLWTVRLHHAEPGPLTCLLIDHVPVLL